MENLKEYYIDLITRHLAGELSPEEVQDLADWISLYPENLKLYEDYSKIWDTIVKDQIEKNVNLDEEWERILFKIRNPKPAMVSREKILTGKFGRSSVTKIFMPFLKIAAVFLILVLASLSIYFLTATGKEKTLLATDDCLEKGLPDGTIITMNSGSKLVYPEKFGKHERKVKLSGEAYFNVHRDSKKPFVISADDIRIKVLGTSFYVNTKASGENVEVVLTTGKLAIFCKNRPSEIMTLHPGEKAIVNKKTEIIIKKQNDDLNYMSWKNKKIVFYNNTLNDIITTLNRVYHSDIVVRNNAISNCRLTATFNNQTLESVLNVIKTTLDIQVKQTETGIELCGDGCR